MTASLLPKRLAADWPTAQWCDVHVVVAVSGGADSVALSRALAALRAQATVSAGGLIIAHFQHGLRGAESEADCEFVQQLAADLRLPCEVGRAAAGSLTQPGSAGIEEAARDARYRFLTQTAAKHGARYIATAHTRDDQVETILHRMLRGTGLAGLAGIPRTRRLSELTTLIRPMLTITRTEVEDYLRELGQPFRNDASNTDTSFTRNRLRHELLPQLARDYNPQVSAALLRLAEQAEETLAALEALLEPIRQSAVRVISPTEVVIDGAQLRSLPPAAIRHLLLRLWQDLNWPLQDMTAEKWNELAAAVGSERTFDLPGPVSVQSQGTQTRLVAKARENCSD